MKSSISIAVFSLCVFSISCQSQDRAGQVVGGRCEGCEAILEYGDKILNPVDTLPDFSKTEPKLKISGTVYKKDGKTPASDVILYIYHTDRGGIYPKKGGEEGWARRHGYIRGWIKTGVDGKYTFYTFRPAAYPNRRIAEHIHITVKEPDINEYYIDDFLFDDDPLLTASERNRRPNRGGSGIFLPKEKDGLLTIKRDKYWGRISLTTNSSYFLSSLEICCKTYKWLHLMQMIPCG